MRIGVIMFFNRRQLAVLQLNVYEADKCQCMLNFGMTWQIKILQCNILYAM